MNHSKPLSSSFSPESASLSPHSRQVNQGFALLAALGLILPILLLGAFWLAIPLVLPAAVGYIGEWMSFDLSDLNQNNELQMGIDEDLWPKP